MINYQQSHMISAPLPMVWRTVSNPANWSNLFDGLARLQIAQKDNDITRVEAVDDRSRRFVMVVTELDDNGSTGRRSIRATVEQPRAHPFRVASFTWRVDQVDDQTRLTLSADYLTPLPVVGAMLSKLRGRVDAHEHLDSALEAAAHRAHGEAWRYRDTVQTILNRKGTRVVSARPDEPVQHICDLIQTRRIGAVLIIDDDDRLVGLVSERDVVYRLSAVGAEALTQPASQIMTRELIICEPASDLLFVMACMTDNKVRHLPVLDQGKLCGVISIGDVVQQRMHALEAESDTLRDYIAAREWRFHHHHGVPGSENVPLTESP
ncbi:MAG: CBS domain-containing protein [Pseudomonadota bacterium]